jgi:branched-chain amino acid transport system substrate-binding protein
MVVGFYEAVMAETNAPPDNFGAWAFDAVMLMNEAVTKAGSIDKEAVRSAFESITGFYGVAGQYNYSADDHIGIHGGMWLFQIEKGEYKLIGDAAIN